MATITAPPRSLHLGALRHEVQGEEALHLDDARLEHYVEAGSISLNGRVRMNTLGDAAGEADTAWLEPGPDIEPLARRVAGLRMRNEDGFAASLVTPIEIYELPQGQLIRAVHYTLAIAIGTTPDLHIVRWWLEPGGDDAALRADGLAFLQALHRPGELELVDDQGDRIAALRLPVAQDFDPELASALPFIVEVAALEEWTGTKLPLPLEVPALQARDVQEAAAIVRARIVPMTVGDELVVTVLPARDSPVDVDTVVVPHEVSATLLGVNVKLGTAELAVAVEVIDQEPAEDGLLRLRCRLASGQPGSFTAHLYPPTTRSRRLRRTLVGGAPVPPDGLLSAAVAADLRRNALAAFLDEELEDADLPDGLLADVEEKWPE
jgi:hypothetical protein